MDRIRFAAALLFCLTCAARADAVCGFDEPCYSTDECDCCTQSLWDRDKLAGDWFGHRDCLAANGITFNVDVTQFYQGVTSGGANEDWAYGGKADYFLTFSGQQAGLDGLWEGFVFQLHAETRFGDDVNQDAVLASPSNANMLYPNGNDVTAITGLNFTQALNEEWAVTFGKFNTFDFFQMAYPEFGRGIDGFMNTSVILPLSLARTTPLSFLGAGVIKLQDQKVQGALMVLDSNNITTTAGFDDLFDNGANILGLWRFFTEYGGLTGSHAFVGTYATGDFTSLDATDWAFFPGQGLVADEVAGSWSATYIFEQQVWVDCCNPARNVLVWSSLGFADSDNSPFDSTFNIYLQGSGLVASRPYDRCGIGYFYSGVSGELQQLLNVFDVGDFQGGEIYYNAQITPWFHLTADLQVVEPALGGNDTAIVAGLRAKVAF